MLVSMLCMCLHVCVYVFAVVYDGMCLHICVYVFAVVYDGMCGDQ